MTPQVEGYKMKESIFFNSLLKHYKDVRASVFAAGVHMLLCAPFIRCAAPPYAHNYFLLVNALCEICIMTRLALARLSHCQHPEIRSPHVDRKPAIQPQHLRKGKNNTRGWCRQCQHVCLAASEDVLFSLCHCGLKMQSGIYLAI